MIGAAVVALAIWAISTTGFDWARLQQSIASLNGPLVFALMATLPVAGFSIGIVYLVAGVKFGPVLGGVAVAGATAIHLLLTHWVSRSFLREPLLRLLARKKHHLPEIPPGENAAISVMAALVPGVPYFARNYLLALSGVPLRTYFWICLPIYVARSYVTIFLGDLSSDPSRRGLIVLVAVYAVKLGVCAFLIARLRRRYQARKADGKLGSSVAAKRS
ncbi:MAG: VTT domain-containing protein [Opitutaceae bacterium]